MLRLLQEFLTDERQLHHAAAKGEPDSSEATKTCIPIDAFRENRLPFHHDDINSFNALLAVFLVRVKDKGKGALDRMRFQLFNMYKSSRQKRIDLRCPGVLPCYAGRLFAKPGTQDSLSK